MAGDAVQMVTRTVQHADSVRGAHHSRGFAHAVRDFVDVLARVPDHPAAEFSRDQLASIRTAAEGVIARIEERIDEGSDSGPGAQRIVESIYEIQKYLEQIDLWWKHMHQH